VKNTKKKIIFKIHFYKKISIDLYPLKKKKIKKKLSEIKKNLDSNIQKKKKKKNINNKKI
jgi:hypothetical protein